MIRPTIWSLFFLSLLACSADEHNSASLRLPAVADEHGDEHGDEHDEAGHGEDNGDAEDAHGDEITLTPEAVASARIAVSPARVGALSGVLELSARVALDPRKEAIVSAWIEGQVDSIQVRPGDTIARGQMLATVQSPELGQAIAAFRAADALDRAADARLERLQRLEADGVSSRAEVLEAEAEHAGAVGALEAAEERLRILGVDPSIGDPHAGQHYVSRVPVTSPIAGEVFRAEVVAGQRVEPGDALFHVGDIDEIWLLMDLYERDLSKVAVGQEIRFSAVAWPDMTFTGAVEKVGDWVEPDARTVEVRAVVANPDHRLKPNMFATATLTVGAGEGARGVVVPADAVAEVEGREVVFIQEAPGTYIVRPVRISERAGASALIAEGVEAGEPVVIEGAFALKSELAKGELGDGHAH